MVNFDPPRRAAILRQDGISALDQPVGGLEPGKLGRVAAFAMETTVSAWLVGEGAHFSQELAKAGEWLEGDEQQLHDNDAEGVFGLRRRRRALAMARWLSRDDWRQMLQSAACLPLVPPLAPWEEEDALLDWLLAAPDCAPPVVSPSPERQTELLVGLAQASWRKTDAALDARVLGELGELLRQTVPEWLDGGAFVRVASWLRLAASGIAAAPDTVLRLAYALVPGLALPPALGGAGWSDAAAGTAVLGRPGDFGKVEQMAALLGLTRDPDAVAQASSPPLFASWTRHPDFGLELDWHAPQAQTPWVEVRGEGAGRLAALLAEASAGRIAPSPDEALADLLTVAPAASASAGDGEMRWTMLAALLAIPAAAQRNLVASMVTAGLKDPDWRVRMVALWGVGTLRLKDLVGAARHVRLPPIDFAGLSVEDRHTLLAMRELAQLRAEEKPAMSDKTGPKAAFQAEIDALFDAFASRPRSRSEALIMALLRRAELTDDLVPRAWKSWWSPLVR